MRPVPPHHLLTPGTMVSTSPPVMLCLVSPPTTHQSCLYHHQSRSTSAHSNPLLSPHCCCRRLTTPLQHLLLTCSTLTVCLQSCSIQSTLSPRISVSTRRGNAPPAHISGLEWKLYWSLTRNLQQVQIRNRHLVVYRIFLLDCDQEKCSLLERQARAKQDIQARRGQVDNMSTRLSSLARLHKTLVSNHGHTSQALEQLRSQLVSLSKLTSSNK